MQKYRKGLDMINRINRCGVFVIVLVFILLFSYTVQPIVGKYVYTATGRAMASLVSGNIFTDTFVITNDSFNADGTVKSESMHGVGIQEVNGVLTVPKNIDTNANNMHSTENLSFVVQNSSDYDLVVCFDIILIMGVLTGEVLTCTITAPTSSETVENTTLTVTASEDGTKDIKLVNHPEADEAANADIPTINVEYQNYFMGFIPIDYEAYSTQVDPTEFLKDRDGDGKLEGANELTQEEFDSFILVHSGETKTFEFSVGAENNDLAEWLATNAFAEITMTVKKYEKQATN